MSFLFHDEVTVAVSYVFSSHINYIKISCYDTFFDISFHFKSSSIYMFPSIVKRFKWLA